MAGPGAAFCRSSALSAAGASGLASTGAQGTPFPGAYGKELFDKTYKHHLYNLAPLAGAPLQKAPLGRVIASLRNHLILHQLLLPGSEWGPQHPDFGPCGRSLLLLGWHALALGASLFNFWVLF